MEKTDVVKLLELAYSHFSPTKDHPAIREAIAEIERLRASSFRWIPVGERLPTMDDPNKQGYVLTVDRNGDFYQTRWNALGGYAQITHWAPIPPLPEKSQESKDEELWVKYDDIHASDTAHKEFRIRQAFLAGLKAAREQKTP